MSFPVQMMSIFGDNIDISTATYTGVSFSVGGQDTFVEGLFFKPDGTKMYISGDNGNSVYQYTLSTPWSLATAAYSGVSFSVAAQDTSVQGLFFSPDGTRLYVCGATSDRVYQYNLSVAWDLSTASYSTKSLSVGSQDTTPQTVFFRPNGLQLFLLGSTNDRVYLYNLSTAWDVSTATYASVFFSVASQETTPQGLFFSTGGQSMFVLGTGSDTIYQYTLSTPWDISTASYSLLSKSVSAQDTAPSGLYIGDSVTKLYISGDTNNRIYQYTL